MNADIESAVAELRRDFPDIEIDFKEEKGRWSVSVILPLPDNKQIGERDEGLAEGDMARSIRVIGSDIRFTMQAMSQ